MFWLAAIVLPIVIVAHRFVSNMGYRYMSPAAAWREAVHTGKGAGVVVIFIIALYLLYNN